MKASLRHASGLGFCLALSLVALVAAASGAKDDVDLVSRGFSGGVKGDANSFDPSMSADGRFAAFDSNSTNLHPQDPDSIRDVFVRDLEMTTTTLVSRADGVKGSKGNSSSFDPSIAADGRSVAFESAATNLQPDDDDAVTDVFVRDLETNTNTLVSRADGEDGPAGNGDSFDASVSANGRFVAFQSFATNLHADDGDVGSDVFVRDLETNTIMLASRASDGAKGDGESFDPAISADGRFVAFVSLATNFDPNDGDTTVDVFVRDLVMQTTTLVSRAGGATGTPGDRDAFDPTISGDGRHVAFDSNSTNLHPGDLDDALDVFIRDLELSATILVSRAAGSDGDKGNQASDNPEISLNGRLVAFDSLATNLHSDDDDTVGDVFVRDWQSFTTTLVSRADGAAGAAGNGSSDIPAISADGRFAAFGSTATNLHPADSDITEDIFRRDVQAGTTTLASRSSGADEKGNLDSTGPAISADGRFVSFDSLASNLDPDDTGPIVIQDVFVRDVQAGMTTVASRASGADGARGNDFSGFSSISGNGRLVTFVSDATNLHPDDGDSTSDVFLRSLDADTTTLVSRADGPDGDKGNGTSFPGAISAHGRFVAFSSTASNLDSDDTDAIEDVFVRDLQMHMTTLVSRGTAGEKGNASSFEPAISADGRFVAFTSNASNLHPADTDLTEDVFVRDLQTSTTTLVSRASGADGPKANLASFTPAISADGRFVAFGPRPRPRPRRHGRQQRCLRPRSADELDDAGQPRHGPRRRARLVLTRDLGRRTIRGFRFRLFQPPPRRHRQPGRRVRAGPSGEHDHPRQPRPRRRRP